MSFRRRAGISALAVALFVSGACGTDTGSVGSPISGKEVKPIAADVLPAEVLGLSVSTEDISLQLAGQERSYVTDLGLFGLREGDPPLLKATLQISRFNDQAEVGKASFRSQVLNRVGNTVPLEFRVDDQRVFITSGNSQTIAVWFRGKELRILSVRADYPFPRTLLRELIHQGEGGKA